MNDKSKLFDYSGTEPFDPAYYSKMNFDPNLSLENGDPEKCITCPGSRSRILTELYYNYLSNHAYDIIMNDRSTQLLNPAPNNLILDGRDDAGNYSNEYIEAKISVPEGEPPITWDEVMEHGKKLERIIRDVRDETGYVATPSYVAECFNDNVYVFSGSTLTIYLDNETSKMCGGYYDGSFSGASRCSIEENGQVVVTDYASVLKCEIMPSGETSIKIGVAADGNGINTFAPVTADDKDPENVYAYSLATKMIDAYRSIAPELFGGDREKDEPSL